MKPIRLRCEYLDNPIGIDISNPRLYWNCEGDLKQTAYQIVAKTDNEIIWDTGKVSSNQMSHILYCGKTLKSRQRVNWSVKLWNEKDEEGEPASAFFEMGLLEKTDWQSKWITGNYKVNSKKRYPVDCFKKNFKADNVKSARLYVGACGLYEGSLNGKRIGDFVLAPGHTDYRKRIQYQTYDITDLLKEDNEISFMVADGWYRGSCGAWGLLNQYGKETKLIAQIELIDNNGNRTIFGTDSSWNWSNDGPIVFADNKDGEVYDANRLPSYSSLAKETVCKSLLAASNNVMIKEHETFKPDLIITPSKKTVLDFHQNIAGYIEFDILACSKQVITLYFGEMLDKDGEFTQANIQCVSKIKKTPLQKVVYTCKEGLNHYKTKFAIFGFQYALVETDISIKPDNFTAIAVYSDLEVTASFDSSNKLLNQFFNATLWSIKNNSADVPTDCPTRERHGWTGDSQLFSTTANYLMNYYPFARKHIKDLTDWQRKDGSFPQIAPCGGVDFYMNTLNGSVGWADAGILIPYRLWEQYRDKQILEDNYEAMAKYARFMIKRCSKKTLLSKPLHIDRSLRKYAVNYGQSYGEWAEPADVFPNDWKDMVLPHPEVSTAYTSYVLRLMSEISSQLNKEKDATYFLDWSNKVKKAYQAIRHIEEFTLNTDRQAMLVRPLYMNLLDEKDKEYAKKRLIKALENYGYRLGTGFLSTPFILHVLSEYDIDSAYRLLENEQMPGWLFMPKMGATTIWESWEGMEAQGGIASLDHYSKGACLEWVFSKMCGVQVGGENHFVIAPQPGGSFTHAQLKYRSIYGEAFVRWEKTAGGYRYDVFIPANCTAELRLPGQRFITVGAGNYSFESGEKFK